MYLGLDLSQYDRLLKVKGVLNSFPCGSLAPLPVMYMTATSLTPLILSAFHASYVAKVVVPSLGFHLIFQL